MAVAGVSLEAADAAPTATPDVHEQTLFRANTGGYYCYRIPSLVVTPRGTILAICEARKNNCRDHGDVDLVLRRSETNGETWSPMQVIHDAGSRTAGNPCPVVSERDGTIWLPFCRDNKEILLMRSVDDGLTWSQPKDITDEGKHPAWPWVGTGPGHGLQLRSGRLLVPSWGDVEPQLGKVQFSYMLYSDDHGKSWNYSDPISIDRSDECEVVERLDGSLYLAGRSRQGKRQRAYAFSWDGGVTWSPVENDPRLPEPSVMGSVIRLTTTQEHTKSRVLLAHPANPGGRSQITVYLSYDECQTWPVSKIVRQGPSAYSDLAVSSEKTILLLYEAERYQLIQLARFNVEWLTDGKDQVRSLSQPSSDELISIIREPGTPQGAGSRLRRARDWLAQSDITILPELLEAMNTDDAVVANWLRSVYEDILARELKKKSPVLPLKFLNALVRDQSFSGRTRRLVFNLLTRLQPESRNSILGEMLADPEFGSEAIALTIAAGDHARDAGNTTEAAEKYQLAFAKARTRNHWSAAANRLDSLGEKVSIVERMGYVNRWYVVGPFDAPGTSGFDLKLPPEQKIDLQATYPGQGGRRISWKLYETPDRFGQLNLLQGIAGCEEAVGYAYAEIFVEHAADAQIRCGADDNCSVWLNDELVFAREQWLNGIRPDRFSAPVRLRVGRNRLLAKICQGPHHKNPAVGNNWSFQLRICDSMGVGIPFVNVVPPVAARKGK